MESTLFRTLGIKVRSLKVFSADHRLELTKVFTFTTVGNWNVLRQPRPGFHRYQQGMFGMKGFGKTPMPPNEGDDTNIPPQEPPAPAPVPIPPVQPPDYNPPPLTAMEQYFYDYAAHYGARYGYPTAYFAAILYESRTGCKFPLKLPPDNLGPPIFNPSPDPVPVPSPSLTAILRANPISITAGESSWLSWQTTNATFATITPDIGSVELNGSRTVNPVTTTIYILTASGGGRTTTSSAVVIVNQPYVPPVTPPAPTPTPTPTPPPTTKPLYKVVDGITYYNVDDEWGWQLEGRMTNFRNTVVQDFLSWALASGDITVGYMPGTYLDTFITVVNQLSAAVHAVMSYDMQTTALPDSQRRASDVLQRKRGVCYDYSIVMVALLRSIGIPARVVMGHVTWGTPEYGDGHAWIQAWWPERREWVSIESTGMFVNTQQRDTGLFAADRGDSSDETWTTFIANDPCIGLPIPDHL